MSTAFSRLVAISSALLVTALTTAAMAEVRATLSQPDVILGETFTLRIQVDGNAAGAAPDLAPLSKDFEVQGTGQSSQTSIVNGEMSTSIGWSIRLAPKEIGTLTIPAISVDGEASDPLTIEVLDPATVPRADLGNVGVQVDMEAPVGDFYVQQEIPVTVTVMDGAGLRQARLSEPSSPDAIITRSGEDRRGQMQVDGRPVNVVERTYLVTPQKSGSFTLPPITLRGMVADPNARRGGGFGNDPFFGMHQRFGFQGFGGSLFDDMMSPGREIVARSDPIELTIKARPGGTDGWFLPAKNLELKALWQPEGPEFRVGEATTRIVQLIAIGAAKEQLPDIAFPDVEGARIYVDRIDDDSTDTPDGTAAIKQFTLSVVPTRGGEVTLPSIDVRWWDTANEVEQTATLQAETVNVVGSAPVEVANDPQPIDTDEIGIDEDTAVAAAGPERSPWLWPALGAAGIAALLAGFAAYRLRRKPPTQHLRPVLGPSAADTAKSAARFKEACKRNNAAEAYRHLQRWLPSVDKNLIHGKEPAAAELREQIRTLETCLFSDVPRTWSGRDLLRAFDAFRARAGHASKRRGMDRDLPALYPQPIPTRGGA